MSYRKLNGSCLFFKEFTIYNKLKYKTLFFLEKNRITCIVKYLHSMFEWIKVYKKTSFGEVITYHILTLAILKWQ